MIEHEIKCLLCGKEAQIVEQNYPGYQEPDKFSIYNCAYCDTQFSYPRVETKHIYELIYQKAEMVPLYDRYYRYRNEVKKQQNPLRYLAGIEEPYWVINDALQQDVDKKAGLKILECGCGMGYLTYSLRKEGFNVTGLDISQNAINDATNNFGEFYICANVFEYANEHKEEYDRIILTQVIEHVESPIEWIKTLLIMLRKNGKVILSTENKTIYPKNTVWQSDLPPVHLWWFSEKSFKYIASKVNASVYFTDFSKYASEAQFTGIAEVPYNRHRFDKNGEIVSIIQVPIPPKRKSLLKEFIKKLPFAYYFYCRFYKRLIYFGKRRAVMGVTFTKG